jgi:hypothetical protein
MNANDRRPQLCLAPGCEPLEDRSLLSTVTTTPIVSRAAAAKLSRDINQYYQDINTLKLTIKIPATQLNALQTDAAAIHAEITTPPSPASLSAFTITLKSFRGKTFTPTDVTAFQTALTGVFASAGVNDTSLIQRDAADQLAAITSAGVTPAQLAKLAAIEQAIAKDSNGAQTGAVGLG